VVRLNTRCYADSASQRSFLVEQGIGSAGEIAVLGPGSLAGVDLMQYDIRLRSQRMTLRRELNIDPDAKVIAFVGRVTRDKGIGELVAAFETLQRGGRGDLVLLLVGPVEDSPNLMPAHLLRAAESNPAIRFIGYSPQPEKYLALADFFCLPSYREGFGNAVIEAAAMGLPAVATHIPGLTDSVIDGQTGILVAPKDAAGLAAALGRLLSDDGLRERMGAAARLRAVEFFDAERINAQLLNEYAALSSNAGRPNG